MALYAIWALMALMVAGMFIVDRMLGIALAAAFAGTVFIVIIRDPFNKWIDGLANRWKKNLSAEKLVEVENYERRLRYIGKLRSTMENHPTKEYSDRENVRKILDALYKLKTRELELIREKEDASSQAVKSGHEDLRAQIWVVATLWHTFGRSYYTSFHQAIDRMELELECPRREAAYPYLKKNPKV